MQNSQAHMNGERKCLAICLMMLSAFTPFCAQLGTLAAVQTCATKGKLSHQIAPYHAQIAAADIQVFHKPCTSHAASGAKLQSLSLFSLMLLDKTALA